MKSRTLCLTPWRIQPGAVLAQPAMRRDGAVLLAAGTTLTEELLEHLRNRGIEFLCVALAETRDAETRYQEAAAAEARVRHIFRGAGGEARRVLADAVAAYRRECVE